MFHICNFFTLHLTREPVNVVDYNELEEPVNVVDHNELEEPVNVVDYNELNRKLLM